MKETPLRTRNLTNAVGQSRRLLAGVCAVAFLAAASPVYSASITLSNATTELEVFGGEAANSTGTFGGYFEYTDLGTGELTTFSVDPILRFSDGTTANLANGLFGSPELLDGNIVGSVSLDNVTVVAYTELIGTIARTTFNFVPATGTSLDDMDFIFYADNDLFASANDDVAFFDGSIAGGDLDLYQFDAAGGLTVRLEGEGVKGATLDLFGSGDATLGAALETGDLSVLSSLGGNFDVFGDLGLALSFSLNSTDSPCNCAQIIIDYDAQAQPPDDAPVIPEPSTLVLMGLGIVGLVARRRFRS